MKKINFKVKCELSLNIVYLFSGFFKMTRLQYYVVCFALVFCRGNFNFYLFINFMFH